MLSIINGNGTQSIFMKNTINTPVVLFVFNRPDITQRVFNEIRKVKPEKLFLIADGPRDENDRQRCNEVRKIIENVDWECVVYKNYSDINMGCDPRMISGIDWVFQNTDRAIFFEDDCLPHPSFFQFCEELLEKYKDDKQIMHISGDNFQTGNKKFKCEESYYFSTIAQCWGWATWKRAWQLQDKDLKKWPTVKYEKKINIIFHDKAVVAFWETLFQKFYSKQRTNWDGQWTFACFANDGLSIMPKINLISNIGFGENATHTKQARHKFANLETCPMRFPLIHPVKKTVDDIADSYTMKQVFGVNENFKQEIKWYLKSIFPKPYCFLKNLYYKNI